MWMILLRHPSAGGWWHIVLHKLHDRIAMHFVVSLIFKQFWNKFPFFFIPGMVFWHLIREYYRKIFIKIFSSTSSKFSSLFFTMDFVSIPICFCFFKKKKKKRIPLHFPLANLSLYLLTSKAFSIHPCSTTHISFELKAFIQNYIHYG